MLTLLDIRDFIRFDLRDGLESGREVGTLVGSGWWGETLLVTTVVSSSVAWSAGTVTTVVSSSVAWSSGTGVFARVWR